MRKFAVLIGVSAVCLAEMNCADAACVGRPADEKVVVALSEDLTATDSKSHSVSIKAVFGSDCSDLTVLFDEAGLRATFFEKAALIHADNGKWFVLYPAGTFRGDSVEVR